MDAMRRYSDTLYQRAEDPQAAGVHHHIYIPGIISRFSYNNNDNNNGTSVRKGLTTKPRTWHYTLLCYVCVQLYQVRVYDIQVGEG